MRVRVRREARGEALSEREEIVSTLMYLIKLVKSTVLNVLNYLTVEQYTTKEMKCKGDYVVRPRYAGPQLSSFLIP